MKRFLITSALALGVSLLPAAAFANTITLEIGYSTTLAGPPTLIASASGTGVVTYNSTLTSATGTDQTQTGALNGWKVTVVTGTTSQPGSNPYLDLGVSAQCGTCSSSLYVWLTGTGFSNAAGPTDWVNAIGGTQSGAGSITQNGYFGTTAFDNSHALGALGPFTGASYSGFLNNLPGPTAAGAFSLTLVQGLKAGSGNSYSTDGSLATPEPASLALLGTGLLGLGLFGFKRKAFSFGPQA